MPTPAILPAMHEVKQCLHTRSDRTIARAHRLGYVRTAAAAYSGNFCAESCASEAKALLAAPAMGSCIEVDPED